MSNIPIFQWICIWYSHLVLQATESTGSCYAIVEQIIEISLIGRHCGPLYSWSYHKFDKVLTRIPENWSLLSKGVIAISIIFSYVPNDEVLDFYSYIFFLLIFNIKYIFAISFFLMYWSSVIKFKMFLITNKSYSHWFYFNNLCLIDFEVN